jgi:hypothetical protein
MKLLLFIIVLISMVPLHGTIGCRDSSNHMNGLSSDHKTLHLVQCNCPCGSDTFHQIIPSKKNRCFQCQHYHFAQDCDPLNTPQTNNLKIVIGEKTTPFKATLWVPANKTIHPQGKALYQIFKKTDQEHKAY